MLDICIEKNVKYRKNQKYR